MKKDVTITLKIAASELAEIDALAEAAEVSRSEWIRARSAERPTDRLRREIKIMRSRLRELEQLADVLHEDLDRVADAAGTPLADERRDD